MTGIILALKRFKQNKGCIHYNDTSAKGLLINERIILVDKKQSRKECLVTIVHELLHLTIGEENTNSTFVLTYLYTGIMKQKQEKLERQIDELAYWIVEHRPRLIGYIEKNIRTEYYE